MAAPAWLAIAGMVIIPLAVIPDILDRFRVVKESILRAEGILGLFLLVVAITFSGTARLREMLRERALVAVTAAGLAWAGITTLLSTHRAWSVESLISFGTSILVFLTVWYAAPRISLVIIDLLVPVVMINAVLVALQQYGIYQPFYMDTENLRHLGATALIGNPNIVGSYMVLVVILLGAAAIRITGLRRWWYATGALFATGGILVSRSRTALIALLAGFALLALLMSVRRALLFFLAITVLFAAGVTLDLRIFRRLMAVPQRIVTMGLDAATSGRVAPNLAAWVMFRERPLTGVGPGVYKYQFLSAMIQVRERHASLIPGASPTNFGEAHNDHAQLLAETGVPGYLLFLAAIVFVIRAGRNGTGAGCRPRLAAAMAIPIAGTFLVLCLAQFPLHVAITRHLLVTVAGLLAGWGTLPGWIGEQE